MGPDTGLSKRTLSPSLRRYATAVTAPSLRVEGHPPGWTSTQQRLVSTFQQFRSGVAKLQEKPDGIVFRRADEHAVFVELGYAGAAALCVAGRDERRARHPCPARRQKRTSADVRPWSCELFWLAKPNQDQLHVVTVPLPNGTKPLKRDSRPKIEPHSSKDGDVRDVAMTTVSLGKDVGMAVPRKPFSRDRIPAGEDGGAVGVLDQGEADLLCFQNGIGQSRRDLARQCVARH